jgi:hypothetical protein
MLARLELTIWFVPSIIENAIAVSSPNCLSKNTSMTSETQDNARRPRSGTHVPSTRPTHDACPSEMVTDRFCRTGGGNRRGRIGGASFHDRSLGPEIWNICSAAFVRFFFPGTLFSSQRVLG